MAERPRRGGTESTCVEVAFDGELLLVRKQPGDRTADSGVRPAGVAEFVARRSRPRVQRMSGPQPLA